LFWAALVALALAQQPWLHAASAIAKHITAWQFFQHPLYLVGVVVMALLALLMIALPITAAGDPSEPAPPSAMM
jgi:magnesium-transporting ATPase (P-type)